MGAKQHEYSSDVMLYLYDHGNTHREAVIAEIGIHVNPSIASRMFMRWHDHLPASYVPNDADVRAGRRRLMLGCLGRIQKLGLVNLEQDGSLSLTQAGLEKLIQDRPHMLKLPIDELGSDNHHLEKSVKRIRSYIEADAFHKHGLMEALRIIHRTVRGYPDPKG